MARRSATLPPKLTEVSLPDLSPGDFDQLESHENYEYQQFEGSDVYDRDLSGITFEECEFRSVTVNEVSFRSASFLESRFERLNAPAFSAPQSRWRDVTIEYSRVGSAELYRSTWQSVHFINCKLGFVNLRGASIRDLAFTQCTIDELDLGEATAERVAFVGTEIGTLDVSHATLKNVDLRGAEMARISGFDGLKGVTLNSSQVFDMASLFAEYFGIAVED